MANTLTLSSYALKRGITQFKYALTLCEQLDNRSSEWKGTLGNAGTGRSGGLTRTVVKPARPETLGGFGNTTATFSASDFEEDPVSFAVDGYFRTHAELTTLQETSEVTDKGMQFTEQSILSQSNKIESAVASKLLPKVPFAVLADGTADLNDVGAVLSQLAENGAPDGMFKLVMPQRMHSAVVGNVNSFFNPASEISKQYYRGYMGSANGADWYRSEHLPVFTNGTATDGVIGADGYSPLGLINGAVADGATTIVLDDIGTDGTIKAGTIIKIDGVSNINQWTRVSTGQARTFAVASDSTSVAGAVTLTLTEAIKDDTTTLQNVTALPADNAVVSFLGEASASYLQGIGFYKDFAGFAMVDLVKPDSNTYSEYLKRDGLSMRFIKDYGFEADRNVARLDSLCGTEMFRSEYSCLIRQKIV